MIHNDKESLQPFLDQEHDAQDGSFELPELNTNNQIPAGGGRNSSPYDPADGEELSGGRHTIEKPRLISRRSCTRAILFMLGAQVFSASMNVSIRLLENTETHLHPLQVSTDFSPPTLETRGRQTWTQKELVSKIPLSYTILTLPSSQILFVRMSITTIGITAWLWKQQKANNILGRPENRKLLLMRAIGGFLGVFGLYCEFCPDHLVPSCLACYLGQLVLLWSSAADTQPKKIPFATSTSAKQQSLLS